MPNLPPIDDQEIKEILTLRQQEKTNVLIGHLTAAIAVSRQCLAWLCNEISKVEKYDHPKRDNFFSAVAYKARTAGLGLASLVVSLISIPFIFISIYNIINHFPPNTLSKVLIVALQLVVGAISVYNIVSTINRTKRVSATKKRLYNRYQQDYDVHTQIIIEAQEVLERIQNQNLPDIEQQDDVQLIQEETPIDVEQELAIILKDLNAPLE